MQWLQLILALSILVFIHEFGHFLFARLFKVRVEKFYMFFNPGFSIIRAKKVNGRWRVRFFSRNLPHPVTPQLDGHGHECKNLAGETIYRPMTEEELQQLPEDDWRRYPDNTEWGLGWVPFGGYCAIAGMVDEIKSATELPSEPHPWEFRAKNAWQRLCIIIGGILVNFVAAMFIFSMVLFSWGKDELPLSQIHSGLYYSEVMLQEGFQQQDHILAIDSVEPQSLSDIVESLILAGDRHVTVLRGNDTIQLLMSEQLPERFLELQNDLDVIERAKARADKSYRKMGYTLVSYYMPFIIDSVMPGGPASFVDIRPGDVITSINGQPCPCAAQVRPMLSHFPCDSVTIGYTRGTESLQARIFIGDNAQMGAWQVPAYLYYTPVHTSYTFFQSFPAGIRYGWKKLVLYVKQFRLVFTKEGAQSLGGFGAISQMFAPVWSWPDFWHMTAFLSLILAFMNFLPIPALDGGYILFLLWEIITRRKPSDKFLEVANTIGFWLLFLLMIFANGNDIFKLFS